MTHHNARFPALLTLLLATGCATPPLAGAGMAPAPSAGAPAPVASDADPQPMLVTANGGIAVTRPRPSTSATPKAAPSPAAARTPAPAPSPSPTPTALEFDELFLRVPATWVVEQALKSPFTVRIRPGYGAGLFTIRVEEQGVTLEARQRQARAAAGDGFVYQQAVTVDDLRGYAVAANLGAGDEKRFVIERGFHYKDRFWRLVSEWDKRTPEAERVERDVDVILRGFAWL